MQANRHSITILFVTLLTFVCSVHAEESSELPTINTKLLSLKTWRENSYGLQLNPPLGYRVLEQNMDDALLRMLSPNRDAINLYIKKSDDPINMDRLEELTIGQIGMLNPSAVILGEPQAKHIRRIGGAPGLLIYFRFPAKKGGFWVLGQAFMQISPTTLALLQLDVDETKLADVRPTYEAILDSMAVESQEQIEKSRNAMMAAAVEWKQSMDAGTIKKALVAEQWLRIYDMVVTAKDAKPTERDIGYMCITQEPDKRLDNQGFHVSIQGRMLVDSHAYDTQADFFVSDDQAEEVWSVKTTHRVLKKDQKLDAVTQAAMADMNTNAETGVRSRGQINVKRTDRSGNKDFKWDQPGTAPLPATQPGDKPPVKQEPLPFVYLSQVELQMLDTLLPHKKPLSIGFYAYSAATGKVSFRTERVEPHKNGSCLVYSRVSPEQPEQVSEFDATGKLVKRVLPNGQVIVPTSPSELKARRLLK